MAHWAVDPLHAVRAPYQVPTGFAEISLWMIVSLTAGFNEELTYRGYVQQKFHSLTGNLAAGIFLQAAFFGLGHRLARRFPRHHTKIPSRIPRTPITNTRPQP